MTALGTIFRKLPHDLITHRLWSTGEERQIDYLLIDAIARGQVHNIGSIPNLAGNSDHVPTFARIRLTTRIKRRRRRERKHVGWKPELDDHGYPSKFLSSLEHELQKVPRADVQRVTRAIVSAASESAKVAAARVEARHSEEVQALFDERREEECPERRKKLSKDLWRALRRERRSKENRLLDEIAERRGGLRHLERLSNESRRRVTAAKGADGTLYTNTDGICEVFGAFYENLYKGAEGESAASLDELPNGGGLPVSPEEVADVLKKMKNNKTAAEDGLVAEMLKAGGDALLQTIADIFTELLCNRMGTPESWRRSRLTVLFKAGDRQVPKNYRPITIIPVLSKLYSMVILQRIQGILEVTQIDTQFGNRKGRGCCDAVHILRQVVEKSIEWGEGL